MPSTVSILKAMAMAFKTNLAKHPTGKDQHVSLQDANSFNSLLKDIESFKPDIGQHLPKPVHCDNHLFTGVGKVDITYLDLEILVDQVIGILSVFEAEG